MSRRIIRNYLIFNFIRWLSFSGCFATYVLFLKENNLTSFEIGLVNFACMLACFFFEIPTGALADYFGRKFSIVTGVFIDCLAFLVYFVGDGLWWFILAETVSALGGSFISGALDAWIKDTLDKNGYKKKISGIFSWEGITSQIAIIIGGSLGAVIGNYDLRLPWLICALGMLLTGVAAIFLIQEGYFEKRRESFVESFRRIKEIAVQSVQYGYQNKQVWLLIIVLAINMLAAQSLNMLWPIHYEGKIGRWSISFIWVGCSMFTLLGNFLAERAGRKSQSEKTVLLISVLTIIGFCLLATLFENGWLSVSFFWLHEIGRGLFTPMHKAYLQDHIPSDKRATIGSFNSMVARMGAAVGWLLAGFLGDYISISRNWQISILFFVLSLPFIWKLSGKKQKRV